MIIKDKNANRLFVLSLVIFSFSSCDKKVWKQTTPVSYHFYIPKVSVTPGITFTSGTMMINNISCSGHRKQGDPFDFTDDLDYQVKANLIDGSTYPSVGYDIPQGIYTTMKLNVKAGFSGGASAIRLVGTFYFERRSYLLVFEFNADQIFNINAQNENGGSEIVLVQGTPAVCEITLNLNYWFGLLNEELIEHATQTTIDGVSTILINEKVNQTIYALIAPRINQANTAIYK